MKYKELEIWKSSIDLIKNIYLVIEKLPKSEEYNLKSQMRRAVVSVSLNIAEGKSRHTAKDFSHFLNIAVASLTETEACLTICEELDYIHIDNELHDNIEILARRINALKKSISKEKKYET